MIRTLVLTLGITALLGCTNPASQTEGPTEIVEASRTFFAKGVQNPDGRVTIPPAVVRRNYQLACATADGRVNERASEAMALIAREGGNVALQVAPFRRQQVWERNDLNPMLKTATGCIIAKNTTTVLTTDPAEVRRYLIANDLVEELIASR